MVAYRWCWCMCMCMCMCMCVLFSLFSLITTITTQNRKLQIISRSILVDQSGGGGFTTIQAAIDSIPSKNKIWTRIDIKAGVYREQVAISQDKPFIYLKGSGNKNTFIEWNAHIGIATSATFTSYANFTIAKDITFTNSYNSPPNGNRNPRERAVAAKIQGNKSAFYQCGFFGVQDTLWDVEGRHYYYSCTIEGAVDFIFGAAQTLYENCMISVVAGALNGSTGYITAQGREFPQSRSGFVFKNCNIDGNGKTYLGRPWRPYARVLFYNTQMSDIIVPQGWFAWKSIGNESLLTLSEYNCRGLGSQNRERVEWEKKLSEEEVAQLANISFIEVQGWTTQVIKIFTA